MAMLVADIDYANGPNYALLEAQHITAWIPVFGQYKFRRRRLSLRHANGQLPVPGRQVVAFKKVVATAHVAG
jgi:hypothetical protein